MSGGKGYQGFRESHFDSRKALKELKEEHPHLQKAAYEARHGLQNLEREMDKNVKMLDIQNDMLGGIVLLLKRKNIFTDDELDQAVADYKKEKQEMQENWYRSRAGYTAPVEQAIGRCLVGCEIKIFNKGKVFYHREKQFFYTQSPLFYPGLDKQLEGVKVGEEKKFTLTDLLLDPNNKDSPRGDLDFEIKVFSIHAKAEKDDE